MRLWLSKTSEVPLREQLVTQIRLAIISGDLGPGQKLPSTRELARRFQIHANTVSAAYRDLQRRRLVEFSKGSGVYVRHKQGKLANGERGLDLITGDFLRAARSRGYSLREIQKYLQEWLTLQPPDHFLLIEPDPELRRILINEIRNAVGVEVTAVSPTDPNIAQKLTGAMPLAMYNRVENVKRYLPANTELIGLRSRSVATSLLGESRPPEDALIATVSRWPEFLRASRVMLIAAGVDPNSLSFRDAREPGWKRGVKAVTLVICDSVIIHELPRGCNVRSFTILADSSLEELRNLAKQFVKPAHSKRRT